MFKPLNERVLVLPEEIPQTTEFGFVLSSKDEKPVVGTVVVGNKLVKKGQHILFSKFGYDEVTIDKTTYFVVSDFNILGIFDA